MNDTTSDASQSGPEPEEKGGESRRARSIRIFDSEWEAVEKAAGARGMNAAEFDADAIRIALQEALWDAFAGGGSGPRER